MNRALVEAFRHSAWATKTLIATFRELSHKELASPELGYGGMLGTLNQVVHSDAVYAHMLTGTRLAWSERRNPTPDLDRLEARVDGGRPVDALLTRY